MKAVIRTTVLRAEILAAACWLALTGAAAAALETNSPATLAELQQRLSAHVGQEKFVSAMWGVKIVSLDSGRTLFEHNPRSYFSPASNSKLYTVAAALDRLGVDYRIRTSLYAAKKPGRSGTLKGDLILYGRGDPCINARLNGGDIFKALEPLVAALTNAGVRKVSGDLVADATFFHGPEFGSGWAWDDLENYYGAELSALTINDNTLQVSVGPGERVGAPAKLRLVLPTTYVVLSNRTETVAKGERRSVSVFRPLDENVIYLTGTVPLESAPANEDLTLHDPALLFGTLFKTALARRGIKVTGRVRSVNWLPGDRRGRDVSNLVELGYVESLPLKDLAREIQKPSQNLYTDLLLAHLGEKLRRAEARPTDSSEELGLRELQAFLAEAGVRPGDVQFEEGSGLSRNNLTTPDATIALLTFMSKHRAAQAYLDALPVAGLDGTLRNRMKNTPAAGNVRAKTGTLRWASSVSGYVTTAAQEHLAFSLMLNRYHSPSLASPARNELDMIAIMLAGFPGRSTP